jgi:hypothetical protein
MNQRPAKIRGLRLLYEVLKKKISLISLLESHR